jgi:hypothetical protein
LRTIKLREFAVPFLVVALGMHQAALNQVPMFAQLGSEEPALQSYSVPVHVSVAIHKLFTFHFGLNGRVYYRHPGQIALNLEKVPEKYQRGFAQLGTPRTWPQNYDMQVVSKDTVDGTCVYHLRGTPRNNSDVDYMLADVPSGTGPIKATWYLHGGGTVSSTFDMAPVGDYLMPKAQHADIDAEGFKIHADIAYGDYDINGDISSAVF